MTEVQRLAKIMVLKDLLKEYELLAKYNGGTDYDRYCALDMAINALEQEPTKEEQALLKKWRDNRGVSMEEFEAAMDELQEPFKRSEEE